MIRFFKFSGPLQLLALFLLAFLFRIPLLFTDAPLLSEDLRHLAIGEKMADGYLIYNNILDNTPPLAAFVYWLLDIIFGRSLVVYYIFSGLLVFVQAILFKSLCNSNDILTEKSDIPGLIYLVTSFICLDFQSLSPCLLSLTFVLIALNSIFRHLKVENNEGEIFTTGFFIGLAYLTFAPSAIFIILAYISFLLYTRTTIRHYFLFFTGFFFPVLTISVFFYLLGGLDAFLKCYVFSLHGITGFSPSFDTDIVFLITLPSILICITGALRALSYRRFINFQIICQRIMLLWLLSTLVLLVLFFSENMSNFLILLPFIAFFNTHFFHLVTKKNLGSYILILFLVYSCRVVYSYLPLEFIQKDYINFNGQVSYENEYNKLFHHKKIAVLGDNPDVYRNNSIATPYLDWNLSKDILEKTDLYSTIIRLHKDFSHDMPDIIIDEKDVMPAIFARVPSLERAYSKTKISGVYIKR